ncbi:hypothetical protein QWM81_14105 [Streptomyces ficellus]|uniref:Uncharacterized protein n=1 Tax=Streptomyces ficellus TaxID=1977088 RepID=A0ABT7Z6P1_9ACTN|nr:hypothetical protein [Streptomyces ficellus]MDN3295169.1 hypothetical protein [Streptomyces ficellus]
MNRRALHAALRARGVADGHYFIEGVHEPRPLPPDFLYVRRAPHAPGVWEAGAYERGVWEAVTHRSDEAEACADLLRLLTG